MTAPLPSTVPGCVVNLLARPEWFPDSSVFSRARLAPPNWLARRLTDPRFSGGKICAITLRHTIYVLDTEEFNLDCPHGLGLLAHEVKHIQQYERDHLIPFYVKYLWSYISHRGYKSSLNYEAPAYDFQREVESHLQTEFDNNAGVDYYREVNGQQVANPAFITTTPPVSAFRSG